MSANSRILALFFIAKHSLTNYTINTLVISTTSSLSLTCQPSIKNFLLFVLPRLETDHIGAHRCTLMNINMLYWRGLYAKNTLLLFKMAAGAASFLIAIPSARYSELEGNACHFLVLLLGKFVFKRG